ncbi:unnamed protein product [Rhodiola kirilowii]
MAEISSYKDYVAGLLTGVAVAIGHPFDTAKRVKWRYWVSRLKALPEVRRVTFGVLGVC